MQYILTFSTVNGNNFNGLFVGRGRKLLKKLSTLVKENLDLLDEPLKKVVVYLDPDEFRHLAGEQTNIQDQDGIADSGG